MFEWMAEIFSIYKLPYKVWTLKRSKRSKHFGGFVEAEFHFNTYEMIANYWRHTLKDLAEYVGGI